MNDKLRQLEHGKKRTTLKHLQPKSTSPPALLAPPQSVPTAPQTLQAVPALPAPALPALPAPVLPALTAPPQSLVTHNNDNANNNLEVYLHCLLTALEWKATFLCWLWKN